MKSLNLIRGSFALLLFVSLTGCEKVAAIKEYFSKSDEKKEVAASSASTPSSVSSKENAPLPESVLVRIGNWTMTVDEFNAELKAIDFDGQIAEFQKRYPEQKLDPMALKKNRLEEIVNDQLVYIDGEQKGIDRQKDVLKAIEDVKKGLVIQEAAKKATENIVVTDAEIQEFYEQNKELIVDEPLQFRVREIVVSTEEKAKELFTQLAAGGVDFAELAKQNSISQTAANGGDLGYIVEARFPEMATALIPLQNGQFSNVFKGPDGFYIVKLEDRRGGKPLALEDKYKVPGTNEEVLVKDLIKQDIEIRKRQEAVISYLEQLKDKFKPQINESLLQ